MFSDALLDALGKGHISFGDRMSMAELGTLIQNNLKEKYPDS
jgi:hypothetical protein